jgi:hypothetical protein
MGGAHPLVVCRFVVSIICLVNSRIISRPKGLGQRGIGITPARTETGFCATKGFSVEVMGLCFSSRHGEFAKVLCLDRNDVVLILKDAFDH